MKTILVPVDFSDISNATIDTACALVQDIHVHLVFLYVEPTDSATSGIAAETPAKNKKRAEERFREILARAHSQGIAASFRVATGDPVSQILQSSLELNADLIVMGTHHYDRLSGATVGRTFQEVLRESHCPLVLVPREKTSSRNTVVNRRLAPLLR